MLDSIAGCLVAPFPPGPIMQYFWTMDYLWFGFGAVLMVGGLVGCFLPVLPGPGLCYLGLLAQQLRIEPPFGLNFLLIWAGIVVTVTVFDYVVQPWATRKFGGSKQGIWGSIIGLIIGIFFFPPFGIIIGPLVGALIGEVISGKQIRQAFLPAIGSLSGFVMGVALKITVCSVMIYHLATSI